MTRPLVGIIALCWCVGLVGPPAALACSIPVFRFALERWSPDRFQVVVYFRGSLNREWEQAVEKLEQQSVVRGGPVNMEVIRYDTEAVTPPKMLDAQPPAELTAPWVEVRGQSGVASWIRRWQGPLAEAVADNGLFDSPTRREIVSRILAGHAVVWLIVAPDAEQAARQSDALQQQLETAAHEISLPSGVGLPGSELMAPVPLEIRFSVVATHRGDEKEQRFLELVANHTQEMATDRTYVLPIFGRGRALEVLPYADLDSQLIADVSGFLCGACSCQVKQANPGFDLLLAVNWEEQLFGLPAGPSGPDGSDEASEKELEYLAIPSGQEGSPAAEIKKPPFDSQGSRVERQHLTTARLQPPAAAEQATLPPDSPPPINDGPSSAVLGFLAALVAIAVLVLVALRAR